MAAGALFTPPPLGALWIIVPVLSAVGYLGNRQSHWWGWVTPVVVALWLLITENGQSVWGWVALGTVAAASLFGLAHSSPLPRGRSLWALLPLLVLVVLFPLSDRYEPAITGAVTAIQQGTEEAYDSYRALGVEGAALSSIARQMDAATEFMIRVVRHLLPGLLFLLSVTLAAVSLLLALRARRALGRPLRSLPRFAEFHTPEEAVWIMVAALAAIALRQEPLFAIGINLALCGAVGYCLQGLAVADFVLLHRGLRPGIIWILFWFVFVFALPALIAASAVLGLVDVWLDLRRRFQEPGPKEQKA